MAFGGSRICGKEYIAPATINIKYVKLLKFKQNVLELGMMLCDARTQRTFSEVADDVSTAVEPVGHYMRPLPQRLQNSFAAKSRK